VALKTTTQSSKHLNKEFELFMRRLPRRSFSVSGLLPHTPNSVTIPSCNTSTSSKAKMNLTGSIPAALLTCVQESPITTPEEYHIPQNINHGVSKHTPPSAMNSRHLILRNICNLLPAEHCKKEIIIIIKFQMN